MFSYDKLEVNTNIHLAQYAAKSKLQADLSWDASKITNGCWFAARAKACKKSKKEPANTDENQVVDIFGSDEE